MKLQSTEQFIIDATLIHGDKYDYSKVVYENNLKEVIIICKEHGEFLQLPKTHKRGNGCKDCGIIRTVNARKGNTIDFIQKSIIIHGEAYIYSKVDYKTAREEVIIICKLHGDFLQIPSSHLGGAGCKKCSIEYITCLKNKTIDFIENAIMIHGNKYDYSKVDYINSNTKIIIICKEHGEFEQTPHGHTSGRRCIKCSILSSSKKKTKTTDKFIKEAKEKHGDTYDYSKVDYKTACEKVIIICKEHGEFCQSPPNHLNGSGCYYCGKIIMAQKQTLTREEFINKALEMHGSKYDYSKVDYKTACEKVIIICKLHGDFLQIPNSHLNGSGCYYCGKIIMAQKQTLTREEFINKSNEIYNNLYDYSKVVYTNNYTKIIIICKEHGEFEQTPQGHTSGRICIKCSNKYQYTPAEWIIKAKQLHGDKYNYSKSIYKNANEKIIINCKKHGDFLQLPRVHLRPTGCFRCTPKQFSKIQIEWLDFIQIFNKIYIQHAMNNNEFIIPTTKYKADGYCEATNTIYEFHGDLWHGNPKIFNPEIISFFGKTYGELYKKTLDREQLIRDLGYNLVVMWEHDWKKINKSIITLQRKFRSLH